ncbi:hypothetical protein [Agromyces sp. NPDC058110]|uniref:hypothetical protein n=1 Tax=Agromyces sp. NPDC058110 TaxID=3346345 RepID=UPI0036D80142
MTDLSNPEPFSTEPDDPDAGFGGLEKAARDVPAEVQTVDEGLPNDKIPDDETPVRDNESE